MFKDFGDAAPQIRLPEPAQSEGVRLRDEVTDDFWRDGDAVWQRSLGAGQAQAERSARRLACRLARRARDHRASDR